MYHELIILDVSVQSCSLAETSTFIIDAEIDAGKK